MLHRTLGQPGLWSWRASGMVRCISLGLGRSGVDPGGACSRGRRNCLYASGSSFRKEKAPDLALVPFCLARELNHTSGVYGAEISNSSRRRSQRRWPGSRPMRRLLTPVQEDRMTRTLRREEASPKRYNIWCGRHPLGHSSNRSTQRTKTGHRRNDCPEFRAVAPFRSSLWIQLRFLRGRWRAQWAMAQVGGAVAVVGVGGRSSRHG